MSRFTFRDEHGKARIFHETLRRNVAELREKLCHYEDLEEQGRLIELPCKVGDTVWALDTLLGYVESFEVTSISITDSGVAFENVYECCFVNLKKFGEMWFLSKAEAEQKLAELKGGGVDEKN